MNSCQIIYTLGSVGYIVFFFLGGTKFLSEDIFTYPRLAFLMGFLLHMTLYSLVPSSLTCPPFYRFYKVIAAIILSNALLLTLWVNVELFITWIVSFVKPHMDILPQSVKDVAPPLESTILLIISVYYLFWVIKSIRGKMTANTEEPVAPISVTQRRQRRSRSRCRSYT